MTDISNLLDQIDRLDQELSKPIIHDQISLVESAETEWEFHALARTALPKLAEAVYQVLELIDAEEKRNKYQQVMFDGTPFPPAVSTNEVRQAITDAMEGQ